MALKADSLKNCMFPANEPLVLGRENARPFRRANSDFSLHPRGNGTRKIKVKTKRTILIVTDGVTGTKKLAEKIAGELSGHQVTIKDAKDFEGTDLLPADLLFLGCEKPDHPSFAYLHELLQHINLAGRPCGIFSSGSSNAIKYLSKAVQDSEMILGKEPLYASGLENISAWVGTLVDTIK